MIAVRIVFLTAVWVLLWSDLTVGNVLGGVLVAGAVVATFRTRAPGRPVLRPLRAARLGMWFAVALIRSTAVVARTVVQPRGRVHGGIVAVPLRTTSDALATVVASLVSLTPGTLSLELRRRPMVLYVHALDLRSASQVAAEVHRLEDLVAAAFAPVTAPEVRP